MWDTLCVDATKVIYLLRSNASAYIRANAVNQDCYYLKEIIENRMVFPEIVKAFVCLRNVENVNSSVINWIASILINT